VTAPAGPPAGHDHRPALLAERTTLAWQRTGLGVVGIAALLAHAGLTVAWAVTLVLGVLLLVVAEDRLRRVSAGIAAGDVPPARATALGLVLAVLTVAGLGVLTVIHG
jgi:uncharacterized membrane protein YidH (DUF202 family)